MTAKPETLRLYATILELPKRGLDNLLRPAGEVNKAAAAALRYQATMLENAPKSV
jgi:hypothetical protein